MRKITISIICSLLISFSCTHQVDFTTPPEFNLGEDVCLECGMIISELRFAASYVTKDGLPRKFGDIGDMFIFHEKLHENAEIFWVHDYEHDHWIKASEAYFVISGDIHTPMGHGIVAFSDAGRAAQIASEHMVDSYSFEDVQKIVNIYHDKGNSILGLPLHSELSSSEEVLIHKH